MTVKRAAAESFCRWAAALAPAAIPPQVGDALRRVVVDAGGLMVAARSSDYVRAVIESCEPGGRCTAPGHARGFLPAEAALVSGTAIHGEDYDDTFEGTPVHVGAVIVPAVLAAAESGGLAGRDVLKGMAVGGELMCRMALVAPTAIHGAGFHPTAVIGAVGAAAGVSVALGLDAGRMASALGIAGSLASGIIEYLAEGTWTKRLHPGWAAQAGLRAARLAQAGFAGPRTVLDGVHGFYAAFTDGSVAPDYSRITGRLGTEWHLPRLAFKPYACGTMIQPYIDCALALRGQVPDLDAISAIVARVGERTVHRLWEPRAEKIAPSTPYSAKFSGPYGVAVGLADGAAGLAQFTPERIADARLRALAARVSHEIDPRNEYPENYTGEIVLRLAGGRTLRAKQPHLRGGAREPLSDTELVAKFRANAAAGGWPEERAELFLAFSRELFALPDLSQLARFRT